MIPSVDATFVATSRSTGLPVRRQVRGRRVDQPSTPADNLDGRPDFTDIKSASSLESSVASIIVRKLSDDTKERLRRRAVRHRRSLEAEVRAILEQIVHEPEPSGEETETFTDWFIRVTRPGIDLDEAIEENRTPHEGIEA
jgi:plasmid stability protein